MTLETQKVKKSFEALSRFKSRLQQACISLQESLQISALLYFLFIANLVDAVLTLKWIEMEVAGEANPLMARLIEADPNIFLLYKVSAVTAGCVIFWKLRHHLAAKIATVFTALVYYTVLIIHISGAVHEDLLELPSFYEIKCKTFEILAFCADWLSSLIS